METNNRTWGLDELVDAVGVSLDKVRETLAIKAINKPLTYSVKDLSMDLNIFPSYDGEEVKYVTALPGQQGASKISIQFASITDQQVRATSKASGLKNDINIDEIDVDRETKKKLRNMGVTSLDDLKQIENKDIDIRKVTDNEIDYTKLANQIKKSRRNTNPPKIEAVSFSIDENEKPYLFIEGRNLSVDNKFNTVAVLNHALAEVETCNENQVKVILNDKDELLQDNELILALDPFSVIKLNLKNK